jgi:mRNA guanylyltransferase
MKETHDQYESAIVEVTWDATREAWRMLRIRNDKPHGNHRSIVEKILISIQDGVELEDVLAKQDQVRAAWKQREASRKVAPIPSSSSQNRGPPPQHRPGNAAPRPPPPRAPTQGVMVGLKR